MKFNRLDTDKKNSDDNLVPLINVVFLMLIFFMVAGQIRATDAVPITPPDSLSEIKQAESPAKILVSTELGIFLNGEELNQEALSKRLKQLYLESQSQDDFLVQISADQDLPVVRLQQVFKQVELAGLTRVYLVTKLKQAG
ncbi:putative biopolymer transport protein [Marinomonas sp. MED121]|uniref:ExbD/TolR family protein n=1 Tax=Marinomonas sp. MED121 TaxID=314277 RepID=UPI00006911BF|nr:biopolymer transporter ExbD [Marinomonas sp. MED121]EAQ67815.1 putative biopolymer transport protein [Marinomonas sp. MED121]